MKKNLLKILMVLPSLFIWQVASGQYCGGGPSSTADSNIESVNITGENGTSISYTGCPAISGVEDQTTQSIDLTAGNQYTLDVQFGTCGGNYGGDGEAWIDFNQNQIFDASESIGTSSGTPGTAPWNGVVSFTFTASPSSTAGITRIRVMQEENGTLPLDPCGSFTWGSVVDFSADVTVPPSTCPFPSNLVASAITSTGAVIDWTENGTATTWNIEWGAAGFIPGTGTEVGSDLGNTSQTSTITGLTLASTYDVYVQSDCGGGDLSFWIGPLTFSNSYCDYTITNTNPQYLTSFTTSGAIVDINNPASGPGTTNPGYSDFSSTITMDAYETQIIDFTMEGSFTSNFFGLAIYVDWDNNLIFDASEKVYAPAGYVGLPMTNTFSIPAGIAVGQYRMRVVGTYFSTNPGPCSANNGEAEDYTINIITLPSCLPPANLDTVNVTTTSVELSWTELNSATSWIVEYGLSGFIQGSVNGTDVPANSNPFVVTGLNPNANYDFYVRSDCGAGDSSAWRGPYSTYTDCSIAVAPFYEAFSNGTLPACWQNISSGSGPNAFWNFSGAPAYGATPNGRPTGTYAWNDGSTPAVANVELVTPDIDISALTSPELSFEWFSNNTNNPGDNTPLILEIFDGTSWNDLDTLMGDNTSWQSALYDLSAYAGNTIQVRFRSNQTLTTGSSFYNDILLDEVRVDEAVTCLDPTSLAGANITSTSADLSWTEMNSATSWNIEFGAAGFTLGLGTPAPTVGSNPYTLGGLTPNTTYDFYVQSACGPSDQSAWSGPFEFTTDCVSLTAPWSEDFTNGGNIPACWEQGPFNGEDWNFDNNPPFFSHIGNAGTLNGTTASGDYFAWVDDSAPHNIGTSMLSPMIDVSALTIPMLSFYLISDNEGATNVNFYVDIWDGTAWNIGAFTSNSNTVGGWEEIIVPLNILNITGDIQLRFAVDELNGGDINDDVAIDDVSVYDAPICNAPSALTATNITANQADLTWTGNGSATIWNIEYGITGFALGNGQPDNGVTNPYTLTGLNVNTTYDFYVQSDCGLNQSTWEGPFTFTTSCITANGIDTQVACDTYTWIDGMTYTADNNTAMYTIVGGAANGCDSIVSLDLTVNSSVTGTDTQLGCDAYTWIDGMTYTADNNTAMFTIVGGAASGCDSTVTLDLTIEPSNNAGIDNLSLVCMNQPVDLDTLLDSGADAGGTWFDPSGSPLSSTLITAPSVVSAYDYTYEVSSPDCPTSVAEITLVVNGGCDYLSITGEVMTDISVYPNPTTSVLTILNPSNTSSLKVEMLDMNGRIVLVENKALNNATEATLAIDYLERGIYTLRVYNSEGQKTFKIVKQ